MSTCVGGITVEISPGELLDRLTILRIKSRKIDERPKLVNVLAECQLLEARRRQLVPHSPTLDSIEAELAAVNEGLWDGEDEIRRCEREQRFDAHFIEVARSIYRLNDRRAQLRQLINEALGSRFVEEKAYAHYQ
jgi:hypothetical protein